MELKINVRRFRKLIQFVLVVTMFKQIVKKLRYLVPFRISLQLAHLHIQGILLCLGQF